MFDDIKIFYAQASRWAFPLLIVLLLVSVLTCSHEKDERTGLAERLNDIEKKTVQLENKNGQMVAQNVQLLTRNEDELKALTDSVFNLKDREARLVAKVTSYTKIIQDARFKDKIAVFHDTIRDPNDTGRIVIIQQPADTNLIAVPRPFAYSDSTINFAGVVTRRGVKIDSLEVPNNLFFRTLEQKTGFLKLGRTTVVQALNSNPAIQNTGIASVSLKQRPNWWLRWGKPLVAALAAGVVVYYSQ
jgi:hypothetical protein